MSIHANRRVFAASALGLLLFGSAAPAQSPLGTPRQGFGATPRPFPSASTTLRPLVPPAGTPGVLGGARATPSVPPPPLRDIPLVEKKFDQLSNQELSSGGKAALAIDPAKWHHAETDNFIVHYRRVTEAQKVVREVEYDLWFVAAATLGASHERYTRKSHVYVFENEEEWKKFLDVTNFPQKWAASFAHGDELFLNVRGAGNTGTGTFDSHTLAHETTHAVVSRLYPGKHWPLWLNEGFAEYEGGASVASRKGISPKRYERDLRSAEMPLARLVTLDSYPTTEAEISQLYQSSEKFVRYLMTEFPKDRMVKFVETTLSGTDVKEAVLTVYGDKVKDWGEFEKRYTRFTK